MVLKIREASIDELDQVNRQIQEFITPYPKSVLEQRLEDRSWLGLVAEDGGRLLGFKLGYELEPGVFYSWLGGVLAEARSRGIARTLLHEQEQWLRLHGYREVRVKSRNRYRAMLMLLLGEGYNITDVETGESVVDNRIHFSKQLEVV